MDESFGFGFVDFGMIEFGLASIRVSVLLTLPEGADTLLDNHFGGAGWRWYWCDLVKCGPFFGQSVGLLVTRSTNMGLSPHKNKRLMLNLIKRLDRLEGKLGFKKVGLESA